MKVYTIECIEDGESVLGYVASTAEKAKEWIRCYGADFTGKEKTEAFKFGDLHFCICEEEVDCPDYNSWTIIGYYDITGNEISSENED